MIPIQTLMAIATIKPLSDKKMGNPVNDRGAELHDRP